MEVFVQDVMNLVKHVLEVMLANVLVVIKKFTHIIYQLELLIHAIISVQLNFILLEDNVSVVMNLVKHVLEIYQANVLVVQEYSHIYILMKLLLNHVYLRVQINFILMEIFVLDVMILVKNVLDLLQINVLVVQEYSLIYIMIFLENHAYLSVQIIMFIMMNLNHVIEGV